VAAAGEAALDWGESPLPLGQAGGGAEAVFDEEEAAAGAEEAVDLGQGGRGVGDAAEGPGADDCVERTVGGVDPPPVVEGDVIDGDDGGGDPPAGEAGDAGVGIDRGHGPNGRRVVRQVQAGAEAELEDPALGAGENRRPLGGGRGVGHRAVDQDRKEVAGVEAHGNGGEDRGKRAERAGNPKHEARNPKQAPKRKSGNAEWVPVWPARVPFRDFSFGALNLFRVSCFGFRASDNASLR